MTVAAALFAIWGARVDGTRVRPYEFGEGGARRSIEEEDFFIATVPLTQAVCIGFRQVLSAAELAAGAAQGEHRWA